MAIEFLHTASKGIEFDAFRKTSWVMVMIALTSYTHDSTAPRNYLSKICLSMPERYVSNCMTINRMH